MRVLHESGVMKHSFRITLWVPRESVGLVIGKKGVMVSRICKDTGTRLNINPPEWEAPEDALWVPIGVIGEPSNAQAAYEKIRDLVEEMDDAVAEFHVHKSRIHRIVGKKGETLRKISADTNVRIFVPELREDKPDSTPQETVKLEGDPDDVFEAFQMIVDVTSLKPFGKESGKDENAAEDEQEGSVAADEAEHVSTSEQVEKEEEQQAVDDKEENARAATMVEQADGRKEAKPRGAAKAKPEKAERTGRQAQAQQSEETDEHVAHRPSRRKREAASETSSEADDGDDHTEDDEDSVAAPAASAVPASAEEQESASAVEVPEAKSEATSGGPQKSGPKGAATAAAKEIAIPNNIVRVLLKKSGTLPRFIQLIERATRTQIWRNDASQNEPTNQPSESKEAGDSAGTDKPADNELVMFTIRGRNEEAVNEAYNGLQRVIAGEHVLDVFPKRQKTPSPAQQEGEAAEGDGGEKGRGADRKSGSRPKKTFNKNRDQPGEKA